MRCYACLSTTTARGQRGCLRHETRRRQARREFGRCTASGLCRTSLLRCSTVPWRSSTHSRDHHGRTAARFVVASFFGMQPGIPMLKDSRGTQILICLGPRDQWWPRGGGVSLMISVRYSSALTGHAVSSLHGSREAGSISLAVAYDRCCLRRERRLHAPLMTRRQTIGNVALNLFVCLRRPAS